jgi:hypothetical protein
VQVEHRVLYPPDVLEKLAGKDRPVLPSEVDEALLSADEDGTWEWRHDEDNGHRLIGVGSTLRRKVLTVVIVPNDDGWDRWVWDDRFGEWEGWWRLVTAYRP